MKETTHLPAGTPVTVEIRTGEHKTEFVDATVIGYDDSGERVQIMTFDRKHYVVDPADVTADPVDADEPDVFEELIEQQESDVRKYGKWPEFPRVKPEAIQ